MESELQKLQKIDIEILSDVVKILNKYGLKYYMIGGTLLGAIRHHGFIPWDDDMDIAMPRDDYEKFLGDCATELPKNLKIKNFRTDKNFKYSITRVVNTDFKVQELREQDKKKATTNISIDIFPIDGVPDNVIAKNYYYFRVLTYRALISLIQKDNIDSVRKRNLPEKVMILIGTRIPLGWFFSANKLQYKIDNLLKKQSTKSVFAGTIMGAYRTKEIVPRRYFGEGKLYEFNGHYFRGPSDYDSYLRHMYGDYMQLPSKQQRESKRHFQIID